MTDHPHAWLWEPLEVEETFLLRAMFGGKAVYLHGRMQFVFFAKADPWRGVLVCTGKPSHGSLTAEFPALVPHPVIPKWLYLPEAVEEFERAAPRLVGLAQRRDGRIGVEGSIRKRRAA